MLIDRIGRGIAIPHCRSLVVNKLRVAEPAAGKWQISRDGGFRPKWRADGKELFFQGDLAELLIYNKGLSPRELSDTTAYLADKYSIPLDRSGKRLFVCNGTQNAVAVINFEPEDRASAMTGLIPVGWFPGAIEFDERRKTICVANIKGIGAAPIAIRPIL